MASLFGLLSSESSSIINAVEGRAAGSVNGLISKGLNRATADVANALGPIVGAGVSSVDPNGWLGIASSRNDPLLSFDWSVVLPFSSDINNYVEDITCSTWQWTTETSAFRGGLTQYYPGKMDTTSLALTLYEDNQGTATKYVQDWLARVGS